MESAIVWRTFLVFVRSVTAALSWRGPLSLRPWLRRSAQQLAQERIAALCGFRPISVFIRHIGVIPMIFWYGQGGESSQIDSNVFQELQDGTDRSTALVGGAIVEIRLTEAIKNHLTADKTVFNELFQPDGALGPFAPKIPLAYLMNIISKDCLLDLRRLSKIRNDFAHKIEMRSFKSSSVVSRCNAFALVNLYICDIPKDTMDKMILGGYIPEMKKQPKIMFSGADQMLIDPRQRYILTCLLFNFMVGAGVHSKWPIPYI